MTSFGGTPGAGRKGPLTLAYQLARRTQVEQIVTETEWAKVVRAQLKRAQEGSVASASWLTPWVMGAEPKHITIDVDIEARLKLMAIAAGLAPEDALREAQSILALTGESE